MSKLSFRARALDASKPMPIYLAEELPDLPDYSAINRAVPQMPSGMEKEEESEHHLQRAISGTGLIIPTPEVCEVTDLVFYERCYPADYKMPKQHIHMQPLWEEQETPEYDIDSEDERWLKQQHYPELTELLFEQMIDKLERCSGQNAVTLDEAKLLLQRADDTVIAVYDYWLNKRLSTLHPLILSVKTESRPGQSTNNPYLAFRRRTEKMQTRKNRKNDETSYEKMVKLRRELARALSLLRLVARREQAKRELVRLTATVAERRHAARDYSPAPPEPVRPLPGPLPVFRREPVPPPFTPRPPPADTRQREKRPYKRRKHRHHTTGVPPLRGDSGIYTSSEEENAGRAEAASPPDDGPFTFRRKAGCFYELPTSTLSGDQVSDGPAGLFQHELDPRHRFTLVSLSEPYSRCIGFGRRRVTRGGRTAIDRVITPLDDLWTTLPAPHSTAVRHEEVEFETKAHRSPKEMVRDYHTSGKYPWRHAFRKHLARNPHLWVGDVKPDVDDTRLDVGDLKEDVGDLKVDVGDLKVDVDDLKMDVDVLKMDKVDISDLPQDSDISFRTQTRDNVDKDSDSEMQVLDSAVRVNLDATLRERSYSPCSDSSYDSDRSLYPVEKEFEKFIDEVNKKWPHFRPVSPPPLAPSPSPPPLLPHHPLAVSLQPTKADMPFTTSTFSLDSLMPALEPLWDPEVTSITPADPLNGSFGSSTVHVVQDKEPLPLPLPHSSPTPAPPPVPRPAPARAAPPARPPAKPLPEPRPPTKEAQPTVVPAPPIQQQQQVKIERRKSPDRVEVGEVAGPRPVSSGSGSSHSPRRPAAQQLRRADVTLVTSQDAPTQIVTVAVSDSLKVRLQNHLAGGSSSAVINGPYGNAREHAAVVSSVGGRRAALPASPRAPPQPPQPLLISQPHTIHHVPMPMPANKLKVVHAHPQRSLVSSGRGLPAVVTIPLEASSNTSTAIIKGAPLTQLFEIKGQLGKGPHLVNVVRPPQSAKGVGMGVGRLEIGEPNARQMVSIEGGTLKASRPQQPRVSVSVDARQLVRAPHHHIHLKNRTIQLQPTSRSQMPSSSLAVTVSAAKPASIPSAVVANLLHQKHMQLPKGGQKIAISGPAGQALAANVQAIALSAAQLKARQARLIGRPQMTTREIVESTPSTSKATESGGGEEEGATNGVRRRGPDTAMEVT